MAITSESDLINALNNGQRIQIYKASQSTEGAGTFASLWKAAGNPVAGANPPAFGSSGFVPTRTTTGALGQSNPTSPALSYLCRLGLKGATVGGFMLYDRLWACSGFSTTSVAVQTVTTPGVLPAGRDPTAGADVEPWVEIYTAPGATAATWTLTGTDANGNTNRTWTYAHPANAETVGQMAPFVPGGGSPAATMGIQVVNSLQCSVSSGTAGDVGVTLIRRITDLPIVAANIGAVLDAFGCGMPRIYDDACLALMVLASAANTGIVIGGATFGMA